MSTVMQAQRCSGVLGTSPLLTSASLSISSSPSRSYSSPARSRMSSSEDSALTGWLALRSGMADSHLHLLPAERPHQVDGGPPGSVAPMDRAVVGMVHRVSLLSYDVDPVIIVGDGATNVNSLQQVYPS